MRRDVTMISLLIGCLVLVGVVEAQDDFSKEIKCYQCVGDAYNSTCADPMMDPEELVETGDINEVLCSSGICVKWTLYNNSKLLMIRQCSYHLDFQLTMIDGVCRTERNDNGYLCMCGKSRCNTASGLHNGGIMTSLVVAVGVLMCWCSLHTRLPWLHMDH